MRNFLFFLIFIFNLNTSALSKNDLYEKIDLFGEVLENIKLKTSVFLSVRMIIIYKKN